MDLDPISKAAPSKYPIFASVQPSKPQLNQNALNSISSAQSGSSCINWIRSLFSVVYGWILFLMSCGKSAKKAPEPSPPKLNIFPPLAQVVISKPSPVAPKIEVKKVEDNYADKDPVARQFLDELATNPIAFASKRPFAGWSLHSSETAPDQFRKYWRDTLVHFLCTQEPNRKILYKEQPIQISSWMIEYVLDKYGLNVNAISKEGFTALHYARSRETVDLLLKRNRELLEMPDKEGQSPLFHAVEKDLSEVVDEFIKRGANANYQDSIGQTPLHRARSKAVAERLLTSSTGSLNVRDVTGMTPLLKALRNDTKEIVKFLLDKQADPKIADTSGNTAIHHARDQESVEFVLKVAPHLLNIPNQAGETRLQITLTRNNLEFASYLIERGAKLPEYMDHKLILHFLIDKAFAKAEWNHFLKTLLSKNLLDIEAADYPRHTALAHAFMALNYPYEDAKFEIIHELLAKGASLNVYVGKDPLIHFLVEKAVLHPNWLALFHTIFVKMEHDPSLLEVLDSKKRTLLGHALAFPFIELAKFFLSKGAQVNIQVNQQPLAHFLIERYTSDSYLRTLTQELISSKRLNLETIDRENRTAISYAVEQAIPELIELLIKAETNLNVSIGKEPLIHHLIRQSVRGDKWQQLVQLALTRHYLNLEVPDSKGQTPLAAALQLPQFPYSSDSEFKIIKWLIEKNVKLNIAIEGKPLTHFIIDRIAMNQSEHWFTVLAMIKGLENSTAIQYAKEKCLHDPALFSRIEKALKEQLI